MFMDISSEMIHSLLPVFMVSTLGATALAVGLVEGVAEATALIVKVFSGTVSDYFGRRKGLTVLGYGLGAASKPLFAVARSVEAVLLARFIDRIGKGVRGSPRDALIADLTPPSLLGAAYGLRQALDTVGAFCGPLLAIALMVLWSGDYRAIFWVAVIPGFLSVALLAGGVREPASSTAPSAARNPVQWHSLKRMGAELWWVVGVGAIFTLARFSEAFLILRTRQMGLSDALAPAVLVLMNVVYSAASYPFGKLADRLDRRALLTAGLIVLIVADIVLALSTSLWLAALGVGLWGLHMGMTQGLFSAMVAASAPSDLRGTAFGIFNLASGLAVLLASAIAGILWETAGAAATFYAGAVFATIALAALRYRPPSIFLESRR